MRQAFYTQIENLSSSTNESITIKDSLHGTSCCIQQLPEKPQKNPRPCQREIKTVSRCERRRNRGKSPTQQPSSTPLTWAASLRNTTVYHDCRQTGDSASRDHCRCSKDSVSVEKAISCPIKCECSSIGNHRFAMQSRSVLQGSSSVPISRHPLCNDDMVIQLKNEIGKLRNQLEYIAANKENRQDSFVKENAIQMQQMRMENKQLKRDLEAKKKLLAASLEEVDKAKDILNDYEKKLALLNKQTLKSSKLMRESKDKFCQCIKEKQSAIEELKTSNEYLNRSLEERQRQYQEMSNTFSSLQGLIFENSEQFSVLSANNKTLSDTIKSLEGRLENSESECQKYKEAITTLEQELINFKCGACEKLEAKCKRQKEKYECRMRILEDREKIFQDEISELSSKLTDSQSQSQRIEELENQCNCLKAKISNYEHLEYEYKRLEQTYNEQCQRAAQEEQRFETDRNELRGLVDELTNIVKENKLTLLQLSQMNKEQEALLMSQSAILSEREERIKFAESEIGMLRQRSCQLEEEIETLRQILDGPCSKEACLNFSREIENLREALSEANNTNLVKEKIIENQSQTISSLHQQIKDKMSELSRAREESDMAEEEISRINDHLKRKNQEVDRQISEKECLLKKLKKLEYQKSILSSEMAELEQLLDSYSNSQDCSANQRAIVEELQRQVAEQKREWEVQKARMNEEKDKAVSAAKFASQKLLDTVADFQLQVDKQKKVQFMLTKLLHDKEEELRMVQNKMSSINSITNGSDKNYSIDELYRCNLPPSGVTTASTSYYSSCSNCCKTKPCPSYQKSQLQQLFNALTRTDEEPIRDT